MRLFFDKRAEQGVGDDVLLPQVIFLIIILLFFMSLFFFVFRSSSGALIYEKAYIKQIVLFIEKSKPYSEISFDFEKGFEIANENNKDLYDLIKVDNSKREVSIGLTNKGKYAMNYFIDYNVEIKEIPELNKIKIIISEK
jgi:hypothetical protein